MKRLILLLVTMSATMVVALMMVAMAVSVFAGGAGDNEDKDNQSASGGATTNGRIVFRRWFDPDQTHSAIFAMNPNGSHIRQITHPPEGWRDDAPVWSPDGTKVAFYRQRIAESMSRIMLLNLQTGHTREVTHCGPVDVEEHPPPGSRHFCEGDDSPAFSPDGHSIAFSRILGPDKDCCRITGIWIVGLDGSNPHQVTNVDPKLPESYQDYGPAFSPDGKTLVFDREQKKKKAPKLVKLGEEEPYYHAVFVQSLDSSGSPEDAHQITPWKKNCQDRPEFSPDGKLVLFRCLPKGEQGPSNLYWVHPDGTGLHQLTQGAAGKRTYWYGSSSISPSFSEGEGWIAVGRAPGYGKRGNADVFRVRVEDGDVVRKVNLTKSTIWDSNPSWGTHPPVG